MKFFVQKLEDPIWGNIFFNRQQYCKNMFLRTINPSLMMQYMTTHREPSHPFRLRAKDEPTFCQACFVLLCRPFEFLKGCLVVQDLEPKFKTSGTCVKIRKLSDNNKVPDFPLTDRVNSKWPPQTKKHARER